MMQITITHTHDVMSDDVDNQRPEPLAPSIYTWGLGKMPPKVEGGILQVCLNLNQSGVGFHRVNLLKYEFSFSTLQSRKSILRVCVIICETIILEHYKHVEPVEHFVNYE